ncbi:MAG: hypothetical protein ACYDAK_07860 [Candidatus Limnocylindrales bacterium]
MPIAVVVSLIAFVALAVVFVAVLRRTGTLLAAARRDAAFQGAVAEFAVRIDGAIGAVVARVDGVRRHQVDAGIIAADLGSVREVLEREIEAARRLPASDGRPDPRAGLATEIERAVRALDMVAHGCTLIAASQGRNGELEAQTSIKRGYLNLIHAREAIARLAVDATMGPRRSGTDARGSSTTSDRWA